MIRTFSGIRKLSSVEFHSLPPPDKIIVAGGEMQSRMASIAASEDVLRGTCPKRRLERSRRCRGGSIVPYTVDKENDGRNHHR